MTFFTHRLNLLLGVYRLIFNRVAFRLLMWLRLPLGNRLRLLLGDSDLSVLIAFVIKQVSVAILTVIVGSWPLKVVFFTLIPATFVLCCHLTMCSWPQKAVITRWELRVVRARVLGNARLAGWHAAIRLVVVN